MQCDPHRFRAALAGGSKSNMRGGGDATARSCCKKPSASKLLLLGMLLLLSGCAGVRRGELTLHVADITRPAVTVHVRVHSEP